MKNYYRHQPRRGNAPGRNGNSHYRPSANGRRINRPSRKSDFKIVDAIRAMQTELPIKISEETYVPQNSFDDFPISPALKANILDKKYADPTPIQDQSIPIILDGKDLIGIANTGTGKTASFLIPLIEIVSKDKSRKVLIVTPTRELAVQISDELWALTYGLSINWALCIGGVNSHRQKTDLRKNPNFVRPKMSTLSKPSFIKRSCKACVFPWPLTEIMSCLIFLILSLFLTEIVTGSLTKDFNMSLTFGVIVAEKKSDCLFWGSFDMKNLMSVINPMSTILSASSRTTTLNCDNSKAL